MKAKVMNALPLSWRFRMAVFGLLKSGKLTGGSHVAHLSYYRMSLQQRTKFRKALHDRWIPMTKYKLVWLHDFNYFVVVPI